jgi:hypothetical protein
MENTSCCITYLKITLDLNPWIWHIIQVFLLIVFFVRVSPKFKDLRNLKIVKILDCLNYLVIITMLLIYSKMAFWGISFWVILNLTNLIIEKINFEKHIKLKFIWQVIYVFIFLVLIFAIDKELQIKYKIALLTVWFIHLYQVYSIATNSHKFYKHQKFDFSGRIGQSMLFFNPILIALMLIPFSWYMWFFVVLELFELERYNEPYPNFFLKNNYTLIDNWRTVKQVNKLFFFIALLIIFYLGFSIHSFMLAGFIKFILNKYPSFRSLDTNPIDDYDSFTLITGNFTYLTSIVESKKLMLLVQRITIKLSDTFTYGILASPYKKVIVKDNTICTVNELASQSHHLILIDGGENSDKIIKIEQDFNVFLGRVDCVIDYFTIDNQLTDRYSKEISSDYANCIRQRIAIKQTIIDEKPFQLFEKPNDTSITIDKFINSINTESIRINMLLREYYKESTFDYYSLNNELTNHGHFELNTLLRQMREGGSIPSRFVDALSIAEVSARYLFSLINSVNGYLVDDENNVQSRNEKYSQLSFGLCIGFLRTITEKNKLNKFEKTIKFILNTKYTDSENCTRLKKYMLDDLHYDKEVKTKPTLFDLFNYMAYIRNKTRGHGTPSKVEFDFYVTLDLISIFIVHCLSKIEIETYSRQIINEKEWLLHYNVGGNVILHPLEQKDNFEYWKESFDWNYLDKMEETKLHLKEANQAIYLKLNYQGKTHWIETELYFKCKEGIVYMYDGFNKNEAEWISFTTGAVIRPNRIN